MAAIATLWLVSTVANAELPRVDPVYHPSAMGVQHNEKPVQRRKFPFSRTVISLWILRRVW